MTKEAKWQFEAIPSELTFSKKHIKQCLDIIARWQKCFPQEKTWVQNNYGVPSLIIRIDCVVDTNDFLQIYEVEERPSGIGITSGRNQRFKSKLEYLMDRWPNFNSVISSKRKYCDDEEWLSVHNGDDSLVLIRSEPEEEEFHYLQSRSVSTLLTKGDKSYGEELGFWKMVTIADIQDYNLDIWKDGFCLKPLKGSKCRNVEIWHPKFKNTFRHGSGISTRTRVLKVLEDQKKMYLQGFISPMIVPDDEEERRMIYRIFFGYNPETFQYEYMGGAFNIRPSFKIHGAGDTVFGSIT